MPPRRYDSQSDDDEPERNYDDTAYGEFAAIDEPSSENGKVEKLETSEVVDQQQPSTKLMGVEDSAAAKQQLVPSGNSGLQSQNSEEAAKVNVARHKREKPIGEISPQNFVPRLGSSQLSGGCVSALLEPFRPSPEFLLGNPADAARKIMQQFEAKEKGRHGGQFPNRFGIEPGWRWDGVARGNGVERRILANR